MSERPFYPFFYNDFRQDTFDLTMAEAGAYQELITIAWERGSGTLPTDVPWIKDRLRRRFKDVGEEELNAIVPRLLHNYFVLSEGAYRQKRVCKELQKARDLSEANRRNIQKRWARAKNINDLTDTTELRSYKFRNTNHNHIKNPSLTDSESTPREAKKEVAEEESKKAEVTSGTSELVAIIRRKGWV